jgi:hypothetical protein
MPQKMEPGTVHLRRGNRLSFFVSRAASAALLFCIFSLVLPFFIKPVGADENDLVLKESGIRYPDGFDQNTVGEVQGKVKGLFIPESGPVRFYMSSKTETYTVIVSPRWYWEDLGVKISDGEEVRVVGSKSLGRDGTLYIIAQEIRLVESGKTIVIRNNNGSPLWKGAGQGSIGTRRGFGSPLRGGGGMGGVGRGRR